MFCMCYTCLHLHSQLAAMRTERKQELQAANTNAERAQQQVQQLRQQVSACRTHGQLVILVFYHLGVAEDILTVNSTCLDG